MATKYGNWVWEGQSTETKPAYEDGAGDGHIFKELDTGESYTMVGGVWQYINLGLAFIKATKSGSVTTGGSGQATIVFNTPFIDNTYSVVLSCSDVGSGPGVIAYKYDRLPTGFKIITRQSVSGLPSGNVTVSWLCTRDYDP